MPVLSIIKKPRSLAAFMSCVVISCLRASKSTRLIRWMCLLDSLGAIAGTVILQRTCACRYVVLNLSESLRACSTTSKRQRLQCDSLQRRGKQWPIVERNFGALSKADITQITSTGNVARLAFSFGLLQSPHGTHVFYVSLHVVRDRE